MLIHEGRPSENIFIKGSPPSTISRKNYSNGEPPFTHFMEKNTKEKIL
jgi:hypothetical protein